MEKEGTHNFSESLPQLYRFCRLLTGDPVKALEAFKNTVREAALLASRRQLPADRLWPFHEARHQCRDSPSEVAVAADSVDEPISKEVTAQVRQLGTDQLAAWISSSPEPQRSALALYYLNEFSHREMQSLLDLKMSELAALISQGRARFQAWLKMIPETP